MPGYVRQNKCFSATRCPGWQFLFNVQEAPVAGSIWVGDQQKQNFSVFPRIRIEKVEGGAGVGMSIAEEHNFLRQVSVSGNSVRCKICNYLLSGSIGWQKRGTPVEIMLNCRTDWQRAAEDCGRLPRALWHRLDGEGRYWSRLSHKRQRPYLFWCAVFAWGARPLEMELSHCKERPLMLAAAPGQNQNKWHRWRMPACLFSWAVQWEWSSPNSLCTSSNQCFLINGDKSSCKVIRWMGYDRREYKGACIITQVKT